MKQFHTPKLQAKAKRPQRDLKPAGEQSRFSDIPRTREPSSYKLPNDLGKFRRSSSGYNRAYLDPRGGRKGPPS